MNLTEDHKELKSLVRKFAEDEIRPIANELDQTGRFPIEVYRKLGELGFFGICVPENLGGAGLD
ncbi:MAG: acyl-CoA dehydrogenase family protein, partial [Rhodobacteraceae bacterium]|nr:acyl-CoA dehydrogenase family protein [Paracoccaceae bacterium]